MVQFRPQAREIIAKVVFYGPPLGGKTTNLRTIYQGYPADTRGELVVVPTGGDRTIFFDFLPIDAGTFKGMSLRIQLYTVPGQVHFNATRQIVLRGVDGVVFVADSQPELLDSNRASWDNLKENLELQGIALADMPHVLQFNKRDLPDIVTVDALDELLNEFGAPIFEAVATVGIGVEDTLKAVVRLVVRSLRDRFRTVLERSDPFSGRDDGRSGESARPHAVGAAAGTEPEDVGARGEDGDYGRTRPVTVDERESLGGALPEPESAGEGAEPRPESAIEGAEPGHRFEDDLGVASHDSVHDSRPLEDQPVFETDDVPSGREPGGSPAIESDAAASRRESLGVDVDGVEAVEFEGDVDAGVFVPVASDADDDGGFELALDGADDDVLPEAPPALPGLDQTPGGRVVDGAVLFVDGPEDAEGRPVAEVLRDELGDAEISNTADDSGETTAWPPPEITALGASVADEAVPFVLARPPEDTEPPFPADTAEEDPFSEAGPTAVPPDDRPEPEVAETSYGGDDDTAVFMAADADSVEFTAAALDSDELSAVAQSRVVAEDPFVSEEYFAGVEVQDVFFAEEEPGPFVQPDVAEVVLTDETPDEPAPAGPEEIRKSVEKAIVQRVTPQAIAMYGEVRELELEVPVPSEWVSGRRMTLQLRLVLVPEEAHDDG